MSFVKQTGSAHLAGFLVILLLGGCGDDDGGAVCGDGVIGGTEACDDGNFAGETCASLGFTSGTLACSTACQYDTSGCIAESCGNGGIDAGEDCDATDLGGHDCTTVGQGFTGGMLACDATCGFDVTSCTTDDCGNGSIDTGENCDGTDLGGNDCTTVSMGFTGGTLACSATCGFDVSSCTTESCGNGSIDAGEDCDDTDLGGNDCTTVGMGFTGGTLACGATCGFDISSCITENCGNGSIDAGEDCDDNDLGGNDCTTVGMGFPGGALTCDLGCSFDVSGCVPAAWNCDPSYFGAADGCDCGCGAFDPDCANQTVSACDWCDNQGSCGTPATPCPSNIDPNNNTVCTLPLCGNSTADPGEDCDGAALNMADCTSLGLGFVGGTLACDAQCAYDTSLCAPAAWSCDPTYFGAADGCDCGCGAFDPDCANQTVSACDWCDNQGSCGTPATPCPSNIAPNDNTTCLAPVCGNGTVEPGEQCDSQTQACSTSCSSTGTQGCNATSCIWDACVPSVEACNGVLDDCAGLCDQGCHQPIYELRQLVGGQNYVYVAFESAAVALVSGGLFDWAGPSNTPKFYLASSALPGTIEILQCVSGNGLYYWTSDDGNCDGHPLVGTLGFAAQTLGGACADVTLYYTTEAFALTQVLATSETERDNLLTIGFFLTPKSWHGWSYP